MNLFTAIIKYSLNNRFLIITVSLIVALYGMYCARNLPIDVLPSLDKGIVTIVTEASGMAPEEIETLISIPLENSLSGLSGVKSVRSNNSPSLSLINIEFDWNLDPYKTRQLVQERIQTIASNLPEGIVPILSPIYSVMGEIMLIGISPKENSDVSQIELRTIADYKIARRLSSIEGVSQVLCVGGELKQYKITPDASKMLLYDVSFDEIFEASKNAQSNTGGGFANIHGEEIAIRNVGRTTSIKDISNVPIKNINGRSILIEDVAEVGIDKAQLRGDAAIDGVDGVIVSVSKQPNADTISITNKIENMLSDISKNLPKGIEVKIIYKQDEFINASIKNVRDALIDGAIMVVIILFLFLLNIRTTLITITAIPLSLAIALIYFYIMGSNINIMTLGGLAVAIGMLVDDAIVDVENVFRRLSENSKIENPKPKMQVVLSACVEIRSSIFYATAIIMLVFVPMFALSGIEGKMFLPLSEAVIVSMGASFIVALTLIPVLCSLMLGKVKNAESLISICIKYIITKLFILPSVKFPHLVLFAVAILTAGAFALYPIMNKDFIPTLREGTTLIVTQISAESSIDRSKEIGGLVDKILLSIPETKIVARKIGRSEKDDHAEPVNIIKFDVEFSNEGRNEKEIISEIREKLSNVKGMSYAIGQPMSHRIDYMLSGVQSQIAVKFFGENLDELYSLAEELAEKLQTEKSAVDVSVEKQINVPQIRIEVDREKAKLYGVQIGKINDLMQVVLGGKAVSEIIEGDGVFDVFIRLDNNIISSVSKLKDIFVESSNGQKYPLSSFAKVEKSKGPTYINREKLKRRIVVSLNVEGGDSVKLANRIQEILDREIKIPTGYYANIEGQFQNRIDAGKKMFVMFLITLVAIFALLYTHFRSVNLVLQMLMSIPLAFAGGLIFTYFFTGTMSVASLVGMIALAGIASRNTIMLISHYIHLAREEGCMIEDTLIIRGTKERINPILMTALTAAFALIPLMYNPEASGKELLYPVSVMIVGGLLTSTLLSYVVTPALFKLWGLSVLKRNSFS